MKSVIFVALDAASRRRLEEERYEREIARCVAEVAALEAEYARAAEERRGRFHERLESTRRELRDTEIRLKADIDALERERDVRLTSFREQLANTPDGERAALERRCAEVQIDYGSRIGELTRVWKLAKAAITG